MLLLGNLWAPELVAGSSLARPVRAGDREEAERSWEGAHVRSSMPGAQDADLSSLLHGIASRRYRLLESTSEKRCVMARSDVLTAIIVLGSMLVLAGAPLGAQQVGIEGLPPGFTPYPDTPAGPWEWQPVSGLAADRSSVWAEAEEGIARGWKVMLHPVLGTPTWIMTDGVDAGVAPLGTDAASIAVARRLVERYQAILGIDRLEDLELKQTIPTTNPWGQTVLGIDFKQTYRGYDVRSPFTHLRVKLRFNADLGRLSMIGSDWIRGLDCAVRPIPRDRAVDIARAELPPAAPGNDSVIEFQTYVLVEPDPDSETAVLPRLVHQVSFEIREPRDAFSVILDANTGAVLRKHRDRIHADVIGNVAAGTWDDTPYGPFKVVPMQALYVNITGAGTGTTDANGNFKIAHSGTQPVTITGRYAGDWCTVSNQAASNTSFSQPATPGQAANVIMNPTHVNDIQTAEATAYRFTNETYFFLYKRLPNLTSLSNLKQLITNVNVSNTCNAFYQNWTINFFQAGGGCPNTAYEEVVAHEYGHAFHNAFHGSITARSFSEGIGDHLGLFVSNQRQLGRDFRAQGQTLRDYTKTVAQGGTMDRQWKDPACSGQSHCEGQAWAGFCVDLKDLLIAKHGAAQGKDLAEIDTVAQYGRDPVDIQDGVLETFVQDDNDANLGNGTPNFKQIAKAADMHSIPRPPDPPTVQFKHTPFPDTRDTVNNYRLTAEVTSQAGVVTGAFLYYSVGTGPITSIVMTKAGQNLYAGDIPAVKAVSRVSYYLEGTDDKNNRERWPDVGTFSFTVGQIKTFFTDDFETDKGWQVVSTATAGRFERVDPIQMTWTGNPRGDCQPEDDATPGAGRLCYVTENGMRGREAYLFDVDNGDTEIRSPAFDLSAAVPGSVRVKYSRYFYTYNNDDDTFDADYSTDDGKSWKSLEQLKQHAAAWTAMEVMIPGPYTNQMRLRFRTGDNPNNSVTDACVDDVSVVVFTDDVAELTGNTRTPAVGALLTMSIDAAKRPSGLFYWAISLTPGPTVVPGLGTVDLGVPFWFLMGGTLDSSGKAGFPVRIPGAPVLKGTRVYTEALVFQGDAILSNPWNIQIQ